MSPSAKKLYEDLAQALGVPEVPADAQGIVQLTLGSGDDEGSIVLVPEDAATLMLMAPVGPLPKAGIDGGTLLWLMRRNFHDSPLAPFRLGADKAGTLVIWGRMPIDGMTGIELAALLQAVLEEAANVREEMATEA